MRNSALKDRGAAPKAAAQRRLGFSLSVCADTYASVLTNPFKLVPNACIPDQNDLPSLKVHTRKRGIFSAGTTGVAFVMLSPKCAARDDVMGTYSNGNYAGIAFSADTAVTGVVPFSNSQLPYDSAAFTNLTVQGRLVGCGLRVRYIGAELYRAGRLMLVRVPTSNNLSGEDPTTFLGADTLRTFPVTKTWQTVAYIPSANADYDYSSTRFFVPTLGTNTSMGVFVDGTNVVAGNTASFEFEIIQHHEFIPMVTGGGAVLGLTPTHSDTPGLSAIRNSLPTMVDNAGESMYNDLINHVRSYTLKDISGFVGSSVSAAKAAGLI